jgi:predicted unusual protein kinase regulating ubiquinone biosynthesis (AarF/ABC1/UbiB family)
VRTYKNVQRIQTDGPKSVAAEDFVRDTSDIGVIAQKMCQFLSARGDVIDDNTLAVIERFQNGIPPGEIDLPDFLGYEFENKPLATASIASVHRGKRKHDGKDVVLKIIKPGVKERITEDLPLFIMVLELAKFFNVAGAENMLEIVTECRPMLIGELDLRSEAKSQAVFKQKFASIDWLTIPKPIEAGTNYLISEYEPSRRITSAVPTRLLAQRMFELYLRSIIDIGLVQADPHAGNVGVRPDGSMVLYDFGAIIDVRDIKPSIARCLKCVVLEDSDGFIKALEDLGIVKAGGSAARLRRIIPKIKKIMSSEDFNAELGKLPEFTANDQRVFELTTKYIYLIRSLVITEGVLKYHDADFSLNKYIKKYDNIIDDIVDVPVFDIVQDIGRDFLATPASIKAMNEIVFDINERMTSEIKEGKKMVKYAAVVFVIIELLKLV